MLKRKNRIYKTDGNIVHKKQVIEYNVSIISTHIFQVAVLLEKSV